MAKGNMILTLVANTKQWSKNMKRGGLEALTFGKVVKSGIGLALGAVAALASAIFFFLPNFIKMGEEARKSELKLANVAKQMGLFGENTTEVTQRISKYAESLSFLTGVDDELIRGNQSILLTFKDLAKSAGEVGGAFDRATVLTLDLAEVMQTDSASAAKQLGKVLQDPVKQLGALTKAGVTFTKAEREKIEELVKANKLYEAQDLILDAIETQVGGTAEAIASSTDKMSARFESVAEELSGALLPVVDEISESMIEWLDSVEGKKAIKELTDELVDFGKWIQSPEGKEAIDDLVSSLKIMADVLKGIAGFLADAAKNFKKFNDQSKYYGDIDSGLPFIPDLPGPAPYVPGAPADRLGANNTGRGVTVNVSGITPTATIGRTVTAAIREAQRLGMR
jgi:hypothetical protein